MVHRDLKPENILVDKRGQVRAVAIPNLPARPPVVPLCLLSGSWLLCSRGSTQLLPHSTPRMTAPHHRFGDSEERGDVDHGECANGVDLGGGRVKW